MEAVAKDLNAQFEKHLDSLHDVAMDQVENMFIMAMNQYGMKQYTDEAKKIFRIIDEKVPKEK